MALPVLPGLSFAPGESIAAEAARVLGLPISSQDHSPLSFALVVAFARCKFRLDPSSVSLILQATIGGTADNFRVSQLADRTFKFFVSSRQIGFFVVNLRSYSCSFYSLTLHLWGNGGPNWRRELAIFLSEEERSWQRATKRNSPSHPARRAHAFARPGMSLADAVRTGPTKSAVGTSTSSPPLFGASAATGPSHVHIHTGVGVNPNAPPLTGANAIPVHSTSAPSSSENPSAPLLTGANAIPLNSSSPPLPSADAMHNISASAPFNSSPPLPSKRVVFRRLQPPIVGHSGRPASDSGKAPVKGWARPCNLVLIALGTDPCFRSVSVVCRRVIIEHIANAQYGAMRWGHTAVNCRFQTRTEERQVTRGSNERRHVTANSKKTASGWLAQPYGCWAVFD